MTFTPMLTRGNWQFYATFHASDWGDWVFWIGPFYLAVNFFKHRADDDWRICRCNACRIWRASNEARP